MTVYENRIGDRVSVANHFHHRDSSISNVVDEKDSIRLKSVKPRSILLMLARVHVMRLDVERAKSKHPTGQGR
jgi:hypothetical protein